MSILSFKKYLNTLSRNDEWSKGIAVIEKRLKTSTASKKQELMLELASFLYHDSFYKRKYDIKKDENLKRSVEICRDIIDKNKEKVNNTVINARIFLAQILASDGDLEAIKIARKTHAMLKNSISANRLANVYEILGNIKLAEKYYLEHEKISLRQGEDMLYIYLSMVWFYKNIKNDAGAKKYIDLIEKNKQSTSYKQVSKVLKRLL